MRRKEFVSLAVVLTMLMTGGTDSVSARNLREARPSGSLSAATSDRSGDGNVEGPRSRQTEQPHPATLRVTDETDTPVVRAVVWLVLNDGKLFQGWTDGEGLVECHVREGARLEAYSAGRRGEAHIDGLRDSYSLTMPSDPGFPDELPRIVVSAKAHDSDPRRILVTVSGDPLTSEPEVGLHTVSPSSPSEPCSSNVLMRSAGGDRHWTGTVEHVCEYERGFLQITAASESGTSRSAHIFGIHDTGERVHHDLYPYSFGAEMLFSPDSFPGPGKVVIMDIQHPPGNGKLVRIREAWGVEFSDNLGVVRDIIFRLTFPPEESRGLDAGRSALFRWNGTDHGWDVVSGGDCSCSHASGNDFACRFDITLESPDHGAYALFAPRSDDTVPPDPVTDLRAAPGDAEWEIALGWVAPADNHAIFAYDIRWGTAPVTESEWDDAKPVRSVPPPAVPGTPQRAEVLISWNHPDTAYHFGIRSMDAAGNWSAVTATDTPVRVRIIDDDGDGMRDSWEAMNGLDPTTDDSQDDTDRDGLTNLREYGHETSPGFPDSDGDGHSDFDEVVLGSDPRDENSQPEAATIRVTDDEGNPIADAGVWLFLDNWKSPQGRTDDEGLISCPVGVGGRLEAYFSGARASLDIDKIRETYEIILPIVSPDDIPGIIVSVEADDPPSGHVTVTLVSDAPLTAEPKVGLFQPEGHSAEISLGAADGHVWSGTVESRSDWGVLDVAVTSESGESRSAGSFETWDVGVGDWTEWYEFREAELLMWDGSPGSGTLVVTEVAAPAPRNDGWVRVTEPLGVAFSESVGIVGNAEIRMRIPDGRLRGTDFTQLGLFGWNREERVWERIRGAWEFSDQETSQTCLDSVDHTTYALFAPPLTDTTPPDPVTAFRAWTADLEDCGDYEGGCVRVRWESPADDHLVHTYEIRYDTMPVTASNWEGCESATFSGHPDDEPGISHVRTIATPEPGTAYHFAIRAADVAGNLSPITFLETPMTSSADNDGDGMEDGWEAAIGLDPTTDDTQGDMDGDGLTNIWELEHRLAPDDPDTDGDGYSDGDEVRFGGDPEIPDILPPGDLNCDHRFGLTDAIVALRLLVSGPTPPELCPSDVDWDRRVGLAEAVFLLRGIAGLAP